MPDAEPEIAWTDEAGQTHRARWRSLAGHPPPRRMVLADDRISADAAYRLACEGTGLLWCGDFQNARHLLQAIGRRIDARAQWPADQTRAKAQRPARPVEGPPDGRDSLRATDPQARAAAARKRLPADSPFRSAAAAASMSASTPSPDELAKVFHLQRKLQAQRASIQGRLLLPFDADHGVPLRRAPDVRAAGLAAHGPVETHYVASLRELLGLIGSYEWRKKGVPIAALGASIHPHHGVYSPLRGEYVDLVATAPLPAAARQHGAFDIGTGTGVLAALLAKRQLRVVATDLLPAALANAAENLDRLGLAGAVALRQADLFPDGRAGLVVCNPPWVPAQPSSALDAAIYDPESRMLRGFLAGLAAHLVPDGEGWLILSDLAEHLGLRSRQALLGWIAHGGLQVLGRIDTRPSHRRAADPADPLHAARAGELTSLWRLAAV